MSLSPVGCHHLLLALYVEIQTKTQFHRVLAVVAIERELMEARSTRKTIETAHVRDHPG